MEHGSASMTLLKAGVRSRSPLEAVRLIARAFVREWL